MFFIDRPVMKPRLPSLMTYLAGWAGAVALAILAVAGLAATGASGAAITTAILVILAGHVALAVWAYRRAEAFLRDLAALAGQVSRGEAVTVPARLREGEALATSLAGIAETLARRTQEIEESRERYKALAESLPALVWIMTLDGRTVFQNRRVARYAGGSQQNDQDA